MDPLFPENPADLAGSSFEVPSLLKAQYQRGSGKPQNIKVRNLSRAGLCIETPISLPIGSSIRLFLKFKNKKLEVQGEVTWTVKERDVFVHGIKFTFLGGAAQEWFNTFVMDWAAEQLAENLDFSSLENPLPIERRSFARLKIPLRVEIGLNPDTMLLESRISDLSEGGLCLISSLELKKDEEIFLKLWLDQKKYLELSGIIRYCSKKTVKKKQVNFHGVEFRPCKVLRELEEFLKQKRLELDVIELTFDEIMAQTDLPELP